MHIRDWDLINHIADISDKLRWQQSYYDEHFERGIVLSNAEVETTKTTTQRIR